MGFTRETLTGFTLQSTLSGRYTPFAIRRPTKMVPIAFGKVRWGSEPAGQRHVDHRHIGLQQQVPRPLQPQPHIVALGRAVQIPAEQPL